MAKTSEKIKIFGCAGSGLCNVTGRGLSEVMGFVFSILAVLPNVRLQKFSARWISPGTRGSRC
jgi:hypothetical protein